MLEEFVKAESYLELSRAPMMELFYKFDWVLNPPLKN